MQYDPNRRTFDCEPSLNDSQVLELAKAFPKLESLNLLGAEIGAGGIGALAHAKSLRDPIDHPVLNKCLN